MKRIISATILTATATLALTSGATASAPEPFVPDQAPAWMTRPCANDEALVACYWDAAHRGDHQGRTFYSIPVGREICTVYPAAPRKSHCDAR